jgi:glucose/arabinose dehydrogenase
MIRRHALGIAVMLVCAFAAFACGDDDGSDELALGLTNESVVSGGLADSVSAVAFAPDGRVFFAEQIKGTIRIINADGTLQPDPFTQIVVADWLQQDWGLTGLAIDPEFEDNHYVYAFYTEFVRTYTFERDDGTPGEHDVGRPKIVRFTEVNGAAEDVTVISDDFPETAEIAPGYNANGEIHFGPDGYLYASIGDYDLFDKEGRELIEDLGSPIGKLLRMNKEDGSAPEDNPFVDDPDADPRVFASGFREPFPFTFAPDDTLYGTDNTTVSCEELNVIEAGENYGWPDMGSFPFDDCDAAPGVQPIHHFTRDGLEPPNFISFVEVSGLAFLSNSPYTQLSDSLLVCESQKGAAADGTFTSGVLRSLTLAGEAVSGDVVIIASCFGDVRVAPDGTVYYATRDTLYRLVDGGQQVAPSP